MLEEPDPRRAEHHWIVGGLLFGLPTGPLLSIIVDHGHPHTAGLFAAIPVLALYGTFVSLILDVDFRPLVAERAAAVLFGGSVLFMLPRFLTLPATGAPWQPSCVLRFLICCAPYPLAGWLAAPVRERAVTVGAWSGLTAVVFAWPLLLTSMRSLAAEQVRGQIGVPAGMLLTIDAPAGRPADGYTRSGDAVWMSFDYGGPNSSGFNWYWSYGPDDLDMYVLPVASASPCAPVDALIDDAVGLQPRDDRSCARTAANLWVAQNTPEDGAVTDIEAYHGFYVALSADSGSADPVPPSALPGLFATLHPADDSELTAIGTPTSFLWGLPEAVL